MDDQLSAWEERLRRELDQAVREVRAPDDLAASARAGGRRRVSRRRALVAVPVVVAAGGAAWAGWAGRTPQPVTPAAPPPSGSSSAPPVPPEVPVPTTPAPEAAAPADDTTAVDRFLDQYQYADAERLAALWKVDTWEAKVKGGQLLLSGAELPATP
ncbi:hypothetical protein ACFEMC_20665 [Kineococcus sp. DHX-1]|uniref:hypothetical protein n=1 Tax=Kineococcus sp. DHX-1 TaxID=3349638 RepID=UPI0036D3A284